MRTQYYSATDIGKVRTKNDDFYLVDADLGLYVVCDGVSGQAEGRKAAETCAKSIQATVKNNEALLQSFQKSPSIEIRNQISSMLQHAVQIANSHVWDLGEKDIKCKGANTTVDALILIDGFAVLAHVGDGRVYLIRNHKVHQLTEDHSVSAEMQKQGLWNADEGISSPFSNTLTRAIGAQQYVQVDNLQVELMDNDAFLLCTDGLYRYFKEKTLPDRFASEDFGNIASELVHFAKECGGSDNITSICLKVESLRNESAAVDVLKKSDVFGKVPVFRYLTYPELLKVLTLAQVKEFTNNQNLIDEGAKGTELFVILSGNIEVIKTGQVIAKKGKGEALGEMGIFDNAPRSASVRAAEATTALVVHRKDLMTLMRHDSQIAVKLLWALNQEMNRRLRDTTQELAEVKASMDSSAEPPFMVPKKI